MKTFTLSTDVPRGYDETLAATRSALAEVGFGVLTEIDLAATLRAKLGVDLPPQTILGACRPALAYEALRAAPEIATLLPCNVVVRSVDAGTTSVEVFDPATMAGLVGHEVRDVALDARERLVRMLATLNEEEACDSTPKS